MNFEEFKQSISGIPAEHIVFVGLGNRYIEDDSAGIIFLHFLEQEPLFKNSHFINAEINPENYLEEIIDLNPTLIIFIDTVEIVPHSSAISWLDENIIDGNGFSTHAYSIKLVEKYILMYINSTIRYLGISVEPLSKGHCESLERLQFIKDFFNKKLKENA